MDHDLSTKTYVVTGATSGIGLAVSENLVSRGAALIGVGRSIESCKRVESGLHRLNPQAQVNILVADLSGQHAVHLLANQVHELLDQHGKTALDGLVNNAGVFTYWMTLNSSGIEMQWAVNHLAPFLLTELLLPLLQAAPFARVVTVSSGSHFASHLNWDDPQLRRRYNALRAYSNTKLANILFTQELNRRSGSPSNVRSFAADPGLVKTDIGMKGTPAFVGWLWKLRRSGGMPPGEAARGIVFLLTEPSIQNSPDLYWKDCRPKRASKDAMDPQSAARLWALSEKMCGLTGAVKNGGD